MPETQPDGTWKPFYICPKCGYPQYCGCASCRKHIPKGIKPQVWEMGKGGSYACAGCGFKPPLGWWMDYEYDLAALGKNDWPDSNGYHCYDGDKLNKEYMAATYYPQDWDGIEIEFA